MTIHRTAAPKKGLKSSGHSRQFSRRLLGASTALVFAGPLLVLVIWMIQSHWPGMGTGGADSNPALVATLTHENWREVGEVFLFTILQALASALGAVIFGIAGAYGIAATPRLFTTLSSKREPAHHSSRNASRTAGIMRATEALVLLPNLAPVLLLILAAMKFLPMARGFWGIVLLHVLLNLGLVSVTVLRLMRTQVGRLAELAWIEGASRTTFLFRAILPILKNELFALGLFVFALSFSSFAIPLVIGGSRGMTVEVLIYRSMRVDGDWPSALMLALLQMAAILLISLLIHRSESQPAQKNPSLRLEILSSPLGLVVALFPTVLIITSFFDGLAKGLEQFARLPSLMTDLSSQVAGSMVVGVGTGLLVTLFLLVITYVRPGGVLRRWLIGYAAPSSVLVGLSLLILWRVTGFASLLKIIVGLSLILTPGFYRMQWDALLQSFEGQVRVAESLGASAKLIFTEVVLPQVWAPIGALAGLASLWAWGDFALSSVIAERQVTLAMTANALMDSYRLDVATVYIWMIAIGGLVSHALFTGVGRVLGSTSEV